MDVWNLVFKTRIIPNTPSHPFYPYFTTDRAEGEQLFGKSFGDGDSVINARNQ